MLENIKQIFRIALCIVFFMFLWIFLDSATGETIKEMQEEVQWLKPASVATAWQCQCKPQRWIVPKTGQIYYTILGMVRFRDRPPWYSYLKIYNQVEEPTTFEEDCMAWFAFINYEQLKENTLVDARDLRKT